MHQSGFARTDSSAVASLCPPPRFLPQMHQSVHDVFVRLYNRCKEDVEQGRREHTPLAKALFHSESPRAHLVVESYACSHAIMELTNDRGHMSCTSTVRLYVLCFNLFYIDLFLVELLIEPMLGNILPTFLYLTFCRMDLNMLQVLASNPTIPRWDESLCATGRRYLLGLSRGGARTTAKMRAIPAAVQHLHSLADSYPPKIQRGNGHPRQAGAHEGTADVDGTGASCGLCSPCNVEYAVRG